MARFVLSIGRNFVESRHEHPRGQTMKYAGYLLLLALGVPDLSHSQDDVDQYSAIGETCIRFQDPDVCMESYGFQCHRGRRRETSLEAYYLACQMPLPDGRNQYVQILYDGAGWSIENQHKYVPEQDEVRSPAEDSGLALSAYLSEEMKNYSIHSSGTDQPEYFDNRFYFKIGARKSGEKRVMRAVCGVVVDGPVHETVSLGAKAGCEKRFLRRIRMVSQSTATSPYRAAGAAEIEWKSKTAVIVSGDSALVVEGYYTFAEKHKSCRLINDCCSLDGSAYLDSCRVVTEIEMQTIMSCLAAGLKLGTEEYFDCLRKADVKVGCEEHADGSRICY